MPVKRKASTTTEETTPSTQVSLATPSKLSLPTSQLETLIADLSTAKNQLDKLQKEIEETKNSWLKEQETHQRLLHERNSEDETTRMREQETYDYEVKLARKKSEDEFAERKARWEKELTDRKEEIDHDKQELIELRKTVDAFPAEKDKVVKEATFALQKSLTEQFESQTKLREQEFKSEKDLLTLKISNLAAENSRQTKENESLKKQLDEATRQVKDIAVQVIHSNRPIEQKSPENPKS